MIHLGKDVFNRLFKIVEYVAILGLVIGAGFFVHDVWSLYISLDTGIKVYTKSQNAFTHPTTTICFEPYAKKKVLKELNLTMEDYLKSNFANISMKYTDLFHKVNLKLGRDFQMKFSWANYKHVKYFNDTLEDDQFKVEELYTFWSGICYKFTPKFKTIASHTNTLQIMFNESFNDSDLPRVIHTFSTEENANGAIANRWLQGEVYNVDIEPLKMVSYTVYLRIVEVKKLASKSNCSSKIKLNNCISERILKSNSLKCLPIIFESLLKQQNLSITSANVKFCEDIEDYDFKLIYKYYFEFQNSCVQPCDYLQYEGSVRPWSGWVSTPKMTAVYYQIVANDIEVREEYLIYGLEGLIGSTGGTLSLFIGFSFLDTIKHFLYKLKNYLMKRLDLVK